MLTLIELKQLLIQNEAWLKQAMSDANSERVFELMNHRMLVKDMYLEALEEKLQKVG